MSKLRVGLFPTLTATLLDKLNKNGVFSVADFVNKDVEDLSKRVDISCKDVITMTRVMLAQFSALPVCAADLYEELAKSVSILSTGCAQLDGILDGGFYTADVNEVVGELGSGKTQMCLSVALLLAQTGAQNVLWIDTCGSFDVGRLQLMLEERKLDEKDQENIYKRIKVISAFDAMQLFSALEETRQNLITQDSKEHKTLKLIVVDSVTAVLSPLLSGYTPDGHSMMMQIGTLMKQMASEFSLCFMVTNNLVGGDTITEKKPALGRAWASMPNTRVLLQRECIHMINPHGVQPQHENGQTTRTAKIIRSNRLPLHLTAAFDIDDRGIVEFEENKIS